MSRQLTREPALANAGTKRTIRTEHLNDGTSLNAGNEVKIWSRQVPADKVYAHGAGSDNRQRGREAFIYASLVDEAGDPIEGDLVAVVTDSEQRDVIARYEIGDLETLADAETDDRTDRPMYPVLGPPCREDRHLELRVVAGTNSDGSSLDRSASSVRLYYTDIAN